MKNIIIVGAGGFGKEIFHYINEDIKSGYLKKKQIKGFLDDNVSIYNHSLIGSEYLGNISSYKIRPNDVFTVTIGNVQIRNRIIKSLQVRGASFFTYIHSSSIIVGDSVIGNGVIICPYCIINSKSIIGEFSVLNIFCSIGHDSVLGRFSVLSPYCTLNGNTTTGENLFMGTRSTILFGKNVGDNCTIAAHSYVGANKGNNLLIQSKVKHITIHNRRLDR